MLEDEKALPLHETEPLFVRWVTPFIGDGIAERFAALHREALDMIPAADAKVLYDYWSKRRERFSGLEILRTANGYDISYILVPDIKLTITGDHCCAQCETIGHGFSYDHTIMAVMSDHRVRQTIGHELMHAYLFAIDHPKSHIEATCVREHRSRWPAFFKTRNRG